MGNDCLEQKFSVENHLGPMLSLFSLLHQVTDENVTLNNLRKDFGHQDGEHETTEQLNDHRVNDSTAIIQTHENGVSEHEGEA